MPEVSLVQTNLFLKIGYLDELFVKIPSQYGLDDYRVFVEKPEDLGRWNIRPLEEAERFDRLEHALQSSASFASLKRLEALGAEVVHYLLLYRMQYDRLLTQRAVGIPRAKFGALRSTRLGMFHRFEPALFQERVHGTTLWDMYDFGASQVLPEWKPYLPAISTQLSNLLDSGLAKHVDWNIKNFVFDKTNERLFYIDQKPTIFVPDHGNEQNLSGIREYFIV